jgi:FAD/FMN-containing dehydrogenase
VLAGCIAAAAAAPEALSGIANVMPAPPMPMIPPELHGQLIVLAMLVYAGDLEAGERAVAPFRALATPLADMVKPMPYPGIYPPEDEAVHPTAVGHTMFMDTVDHGVAATILGYLQRSDAPVRVAQLRVLGGAMARVPADATAFAHRGSKIMANVAAFYQGPEDRAVRQGWVDEFAAALQQADRGAYAGFLGDEGQARVRQAYPEATWERLVAVKRRYDPGNLFRRNQNIPPTDDA